VRAAPDGNDAKPVCVPLAARLDAGMVRANCRLLDPDQIGFEGSAVMAAVNRTQSAGFKAEQSSDIRATLWTNFTFICALAGTTAAVRLPIGEIRTAPASRELFRKVAAEVCEVARAEGISLPADLFATSAQLLWLHAWPGGLLLQKACLNSRVHCYFHFCC